MKIKEMKVELCQRIEIKDFVEKWHYSKSINGLMSDYCFKLTYDNKMIGAMIYGRVAMANAWKKYTSKPEDLIELRRLCCIDDTPKNTESYFIGKTLRYLKNNTDIKTVVSYADTMQGHEGIIYKASNFKYLGLTAKGKVIMHGEKQYHDKAVRTMYKGKLKPFASRLKEALENGTAYYKKTTGKHIYIFNIEKKYYRRG
jgi:hypothetical protein